MGGSLDQVKSWVGKTVICIDPEKESSPARRKQLEKGKTYRIKSVSVGNHDAFVYLEGFPDKIYSEYSKRNITNCFNARAFVLADREGN